MEEMTLNKDQTEKKRTIVNKLVNSGINITPSILEFVLNLEKPMEDLNLIIKETSFIPDFKSHLTEKVLTKISNDQIQKVLKRKVISPKAHINENKMKNRDLPTIVSDNLNLKKLREDPNPLAAPYNNQLIQIKKISQSDSNTSLTNDISIEKKIEVKPFGSTKSSFAFNPIAKQYSSDYKILTDPTGKLFTTGEYEDFYDYTVDKFNKLRMMMRKRSDVLSATNINNILRLTNSAEVSTIGLVSNMHQTKNNNYLFNLEDLTGIVNVLVRKDSEKEENFKTIQRTVNDQMVYVEGTYSPGEKGKKGIIFVNYITKIDIPTDFKPSISTDPLSIALISDTHIGSKEFEETLLKRFINFLNGKIGDKNIRMMAGKVKYLVINGDLVDGIGVYPKQHKDLSISDIYQQYKRAAEILAEIPEYIKIFYTSGNHEPVRNAIPRPAVPKKYCEDLVNFGITCIGNPSMIETHNVKTLIYHGESMHDMNMLIHDLDINKPTEIMKELLICRHLAPVYGEKTQIAPTNKDWLLIEKIPDIFHTAHVHINGLGYHRNVSLVNSGCFQAQTDFMKSFGIVPTPGIVPIIELDTMKPFELDLKTNR